LRCGELERRVAALEAQLAATKKTSATSSKPPSSDIVKLKPQRKRSKRRRGAQPGHAKHDRPSFEPEQITHVEDYRLEACPQCGGTLELIEEPARVLQQIEIPTKPVQVIEHRSRVCRCGKCNREFTQPIPREVRAAGLVGPQLTALVAYLKGACHCSFTTIRKFLRDVLKVSLSRGQLRKLCAKVAAAWKPLISNCWMPCPKSGGSTSTRPATRRTAKRCGPGASAPRSSRCSRSNRRAAARS